jgi:hypothetical protein
MSSSPRYTELKVCNSYHASYMGHEGKQIQSTNTFTTLSMSGKYTDIL